MAPRPLRPLGPLLAALLVSLLAPSAAEAQFYVQTETATVYTPLANQPGVQALTDFAFSSRDEGTATLTIPFPFRYLGTAHTSLDISVNGHLVFGNAGLGGFTNRAIDDGFAPDDMIAMWWDDLILPDPAGYSSHGVLGTAPNRIFVIEVRDWEHFSFSNSLDGRFQVWLYEGPAGRFEVHYDQLLQEDYSATAGYRGPAGATFGAFRPCSLTSPYCDADDYASLTGRLVRVEQAQGPELLGSIGAFGRGALPGQSATVPVTVRNVGTDPVGPVTHALYLSTDESFDAATDVPVATFATAALPAGDQPVTVSVPATVPPGTPPGDYRLLLVVDVNDAIPEVSEQNNVAAAPTRFATAHELSPTAVSAPLGAAPGATLQVDLQLENTGVPYAGPMSVAFRGSVDRLVGPNDPALATRTVMLGGGAVETLTVDVPLPASLPIAPYYVVVELDPAGAIPQVDRANDARISEQTFPTAPDLVARSVTAPAGAEPGARVDLSLVLENQGLAVSGPVTIRAIASPDPIYDLNDPVLGEVTANVQLARGAQQTIPMSLIVPPLRAGNYYAIAVVDPQRRIPETDDFNNTRVSATTFATGPDLTVVDVAMPAAAAPGEAIAITTRLDSIGAPFPGTVSYAIYLSEDEVIDAADVRLGPFVVTIGDSPRVDDTQTIPFPAAPPGTYQILAEVDGPGAVVEADETNNRLLDDDEVETGPDFTVFSIGVDPRTAVPGDTVTVTADVYNYGTDHAAPIPYRVLLSVDRDPSPEDHELVRAVLPPLARDERFALSVDVPVGPAVSPASYEVLVQIDPDGQIPEQDEDDNVRDGFNDLVVQGPNPVVTRVLTPPFAFTGDDLQVTLLLDNAEGVAATDVQVALFLSDAGVLLEGQEVGRVGPLSVPAGATRTVTATAAIPADARLGVQLFGAQVDPDGALAETNERDNLTLREGGLVIMAPSADLRGRVVATATAAAAGEPLAITRLLENVGAVDAPDLAYRYVLVPDGPAPGPDLVVATASVSLGVGETDYGIDVVDVPVEVAPGRYRLGLVLDPDDLVPEVDETDNRAIGPIVDVAPPDLTIVTAALPVAREGVPYEAALYALGGTQQVGWQLAGGALPAGLTLDQITGFVRGTPRAAGRFDFVAEVISGPQRARRALSLRVVSPTVPLALSPWTPAPATLGRPYAERLVAVGGVPPYQFSAVTALPAGLTLAADGTLGGTPTQEGTVSVLVRVEDALGATASGEVRLRVVRADHRVLINLLPLPVAEVDAEYCRPQDIQLFAAGGTAPYTWTALAPPPDGLELDPDGRLCGAPRRAGHFTLQVRVQDADGLVDTAWFGLDVQPAEGFRVATTSLPPAVPGEGYAATLEVREGTPPLRWTLVSGDLPGGLVLDEDGAISGSALEQETRAFLVQVQDGRGQVRRQPLSIRVAWPAMLEEGGGCVCAAPVPGGPGLGVGLLLGLGLLARRRRR